MTARYALYLTPPTDHPLWSVGCAWLGRGADGLSAGQPRLHRRQPWRYGFHATLKAPMRLASGMTESDLLAAVGDLVCRHSAFELPLLAVSTLGRSLALRPVAPPTADHPLRRLADDCVRGLDAFRAPMTPVELVHRVSKTALDAEQEDLLRRWGYPHVLERWHWHYTLSDPLVDPEVCRSLARDARSWFADAVQTPCRCDAVSVFHEPEAGAPLRVVGRFALARARGAQNDAGVPERGVFIPA